MHAAEVIEVLDGLDRAGVRHWVGGGWGVVALTGRQTRAHRDLDLAVDAGDLPACLVVLTGLGYTAETDWRPVLPGQVTGRWWPAPQPAGRVRRPCAAIPAPGSEWSRIHVSLLSLYSLNGAGVTVTGALPRWRGKNFGPGTGFREGYRGLCDSRAVTALVRKA
jgi:hypothetical protein